jgi:hypothetical protein
MKISIGFFFFSCSEAAVAEAEFPTLNVIANELEGK